MFFLFFIHIHSFVVFQHCHGGGVTVKDSSQLENHRKIHNINYIWLVIRFLKTKVLVIFIDHAPCRNKTSSGSQKSCKKVDPENTYVHLLSKTGLSLLRCGRGATCCNI